MGTKNNPGAFDCYTKAGPDEPIFTLRANDPLAPDAVEDWALAYEARGGDKAKVDEALNCAHQMRVWRKENC